MFSLSNIIIQTEIYPIEREKLIEDNMVIVFAKLIIWFSSCVPVGGIVVSLFHQNCDRNWSCSGRPEARSEKKAFPHSLSNKQK